MRIFITGATGAIGQRLLPQLKERGHQLVASVRSAGRLDRLRAMGVEAVILDLLDPDAVRLAVCAARADAIIHEATALGGVTDLKHFDRSFALTNQLRMRATDNLIAAARASGVRKVVAQSYTGWPYGRRGGQIKTEDDPLDPYPVPSMRESLEAIKHLEHAVVGAGGIALRYGAFYGAPDDPMLALVRKRMFPIIGDGGGVWSWLHLEDAAAATVLAVERGGSGVYNIADDDPAPVREWLPALAAVIGAPPPRRIPRFLARLIAGEAVVSMMTEVRGVSSAKAKRELGWTVRYPTWRRGFVESYGRRAPDSGGAERVDSTRAATQHAGA
jgi:nucleoside-diphosphate-sugar epimerase